MSVFVCVQEVGVRKVRRGETVRGDNGGGLERAASEENAYESSGRVSADVDMHTK